MHPAPARVIQRYTGTPQDSLEQLLDDLSQTHAITSQMTVPEAANVIYDFYSRGRPDQRLEAKEDEDVYGKLRGAGVKSIDESSVPGFMKMSNPYSDEDGLPERVSVHVDPGQIYEVVGTLYQMFTQKELSCVSDMKIPNRSSEIASRMDNLVIYYKETDGSAKEALLSVLGKMKGSLLAEHPAMLDSTSLPGVATAESWTSAGWERSTHIAEAYVAWLKGGKNGSLSEAVKAKLKKKGYDLFDLSRDPRPPKKWSDGCCIVMKPAPAATALRSLLARKTVR